MSRSNHKKENTTNLTRVCELVSCEYHQFVFENMTCDWLDFEFVINGGCQLATFGI